jgi:hypothetical protein
LAALSEAGRTFGSSGADRSKPGQLPPNHNPKSKARKMQMPGTIGHILIEYLADDVRECASLLGGAASAWPSLYRL